MPNNWSITWRASGSNQANAQTRTLTAVKPALAENYRRITSITRRNGLYCKTGGTSQRVVLQGYDELLINGTVLMKSTTGQCTVYGSGPSSTDYMVTTFADISTQQSRIILDAWKAGTLQIRRTAWIASATSGSHGQPYFRNGVYHDDITISGTDSAYMPIVEVTAFNAADDARLYAESWKQPPFDFTVNTSVTGSEYWENPDKLHRRLVITAENLTGESTAMQPVVLDNNTLSTTWSVSQGDVQFTRAGDGFTRGNRYRITFALYVGMTADELIESATAYAEIDVAAVPFHMSRAGNGVAVGKYSAAGSDINEKLFECAYPARFYEGIEGVSSYVEGEEKTGGVWVDGNPIYRTVVHFNIAATGTKVQIASVDGLDTLIGIGGSLVRSGQNIKLPPTFFYSASDFNSVWVEDTVVCAIAMTAASGYIVIEYTKNEEDG